MSGIRTLGGTLALASTLAACAVPLAPGAAQVRVTSAGADVQSCKAVGNVHVQPGLAWEDELRNLTIGDGGDTLLILEPDVGIAYRCAKD
jgi:hypothetical protein